ncbi:MAG TPA: hypothetical protein VF989_02810 [Polyangiaceae bacterium]
MPNPLTMTLVSSRQQRNLARPGETVTLEFQKPPKLVTELVVEVFQTGLRVGAVPQGDHLLATFRGEIKDNNLNITGVELAPVARDLDMPLLINAPGLSAPAQVVLTDSSRFIFRNELTVHARGRIAGRTETFIGRSVLAVDYPLFMIAPTPTATVDTSLNSVGRWAQQWAARDPSLRTLLTIAPQPKATTVLDSNYDELVTRCGSVAPFSIVALAVGHGDGGQGNADGQPWCDIVAEDEPPRPDSNNPGVELVDHLLLVTLLHLRDGSDGVATPGTFTTRRLRALNRMGDAFQQVAASELAKFTRAEFSATRTGGQSDKRIPAIRKLLLHTCNAGNSIAFLTRFSDRVRVPVQAHTDSIVYDDAAATTDPLEAGYESSGGSGSTTEWPTSKVADEAEPLNLLPQNVVPTPGSAEDRGPPRPLPPP